MSTPKAKTVYVKSATDEDALKTTWSDRWNNWGKTSLIGGFVGIILGALGTLLFGYLTKDVEE